MFPFRSHRPLRHRAIFPLCVFAASNRPYRTAARTNGPRSPGLASRVARRPAEHSVLVEPAHGVFFSCYHFCGPVFTVSGELRVCSSKCKIINWLPLESVQRHIQVLRGPKAYPIWAQSLKNAYAITETKLGTRPREEPLRLLGPAAYSSLVSGNSASICNCRSLISREAVLESARGWPWSSRESHPGHCRGPADGFTHRGRAWEL